MKSSLSPADSASARERLLAAAEQLIYRGGIHATGIDAIVRQSGAARKSMYAHFASKDELVAAALERRDERWMNWFEAGVRGAGHSPRAQLLAVFDVLRSWFVTDDFHGCAFLNAAGEIALPEDPIRRVAQMHKARLLAFVETVCIAYGQQCHPALGLDQAQALARQWLILIDGAIGVALVSGNPDAAGDALAVATLLLSHPTQPT